MRISSSPTARPGAFAATPIPRLTLAGGTPPEASARAPFLELPARSLDGTLRIRHGFHPPLPQPTP